MKNRQFIFVLWLLLPVSVFSQLLITPDSSANVLAQTIMGTGATVSNATLDCGTNGAATFSYSGTTLGLSNGVILTTGLASDAALTARIVSQSTGNIFTDPDLASITTGNQNDVCYLVFDFVPHCNQFKITFEFGSSEYQGYQCSNFNDVFGLFLTGPNPAGGNYLSVNCATLPGGTPVSINNINNGQSPCTSASNPTYFIANFTGTDVVYEGLTTAITSVKAVMTDSTYHLKIAICDISDEAYDSGVFIQSDSSSCASTGVNKFLTESDQVIISPNPSTKLITIRGTKELDAIIVYNSLGEIIFQTQTRNNAEQIDMSEFPAGVYTLRAQGRFMKVVKE